MGKIIQERQLSNAIHLFFFFFYTNLSIKLYKTIENRALLCLLQQIFLLKSTAYGYSQRVLSKSLLKYLVAIIFQQFPPSVIPYITIYQAQNKM